MLALKRFLVVISFLSGLLGLWLSLTAANSYNPCEFANNNILFVKEQTQQAIAAPDLKMSRYYAYKALNGIWNAKYSFSECGCEDAIDNMELASENLKEATKASRVEDSKIFLKIAIKNTRNGINAIKEYETSISKYGNKDLSLNTKDAEPVPDEPTEAKSFSVERMEANLTRYSKSIDNVLKLNDCEKARLFIVDTQKKTKAELMNPDLSQRKYYFHKRILQITNEALKTLEECSGQGLLAGK